MCKIEAVKRRNWAMAIRAPEAMSCDSLMAIDAAPNAQAATNDAVANVFSNVVVIGN